MIVVHADASRVQRIREGSTILGRPSGIFRIEGSGASTCLQGIFTNDLGKLEIDVAIYGAFLTPKGMIITPAWIVRDEQGYTVISPDSGSAALLDIFKRTLPPRLAKMVDLSATHRVLYALGDRALPFPVVADVQVATAPAAAWFTYVGIGEATSIATLRDLAAMAGATIGTETDRHVARVLAGWPALGAEIDDKTLPQEVRFDDLGGVSYNKGCYTGQETVARIHFRGHPNRELRGLRWLHAPDAEAPSILSEDRTVGSVTSLVLDPAASFGLGLIRREVTIGSMVTAGGQRAEVVGLPFAVE